jgi:Uncharacterized conserved protein
MTNILPNDVSDDVLGHRGQHSVSMDYDGLGAFPPSNSITDFTSILENNNTILPSHAKVTPVVNVSNMHHENLRPSPVPPMSNMKFDSSKENAAKSSSTTHTNTTTTTLNEKKRVLEETEASRSPNKKKTVQLPSAAVVTVPKQNASVVTPHVVSGTVQEIADDAGATSAANMHSVPSVAATANQPTCDSTSRVIKSNPAAIVVSQSNANAKSLSKGTSNVVTKKVVNMTPMTNFSHEFSSDMSSNGSVKTEENFKGVAQAAVTSLILSAGTNANGNDESQPSFSKPVDTSTAHVAALTSTNWVAACAASISGAPPGTAQAAQAAALAAANDPAAAKAARAKRATLTADERARQNRDRNREHARNTRLRKKAYVEELKRTLTELVNQRDAAEVEKRHEKQRDLEVREVRYRVMEEFLKLRARGAEPNLLVRWIAILEDGFTLTLPKTEYRAMVSSQHPSLTRRVSTDSTGLVSGETDSSKQVLRDANQCFDDASKFASFISSVFMGNAVRMSYHCERTNFMMDGVKAILDWTLNATPQSPNGEPASVGFVLKGCMRATFSPASNKLANAELLFDTGAVISQVKIVKSHVSSFCSVEETDALLDSLPQVTTKSGPNGSLTMPSSVSVVSTDKDHSSDEECVVLTKVKTDA